MNKQDWCTGWWDTYLGKDISGCCQMHDETLSTSKFYQCLKSKIGWFHAFYITAGGAVGAWVKYPMRMWERLS